MAGFVRFFGLNADGNLQYRAQLRNADEGLLNWHCESNALLLAVRKELAGGLSLSETARASHVRQSLGCRSAADAVRDFTLLPAEIEPHHGGCSTHGVHTFVDVHQPRALRLTDAGGSAHQCPSP